MTNYYKKIIGGMQTLPGFNHWGPQKRGWAFNNRVFQQGNWQPNDEIEYKYRYGLPATTITKAQVTNKVYRKVMARLRDTFNRQVRTPIFQQLWNCTRMDLWYDDGHIVLLRSSE